MKFVIVNTIDQEACRSLAAGEIREHEAARRLSGCCWLVRASAEVDDPEEALRDAVHDYFSSEQGQEVLRREEIRPVTWEAAIPWIPDESWSRFGLEVIRHPDVERIVLDASEDLAGSLGIG